MKKRIGAVEQISQIEREYQQVQIALQNEREKYLN